MQVQALPGPLLSYANMTIKMEKNKINDLTEEEKEILRRHHEARRKALLAELSQINSKIESYGGESAIPKAQTKIAFSGNSFPKTVKSVPSKTIHVINDLGHAVPIGEIIQRYSQFEPAILKDGKVKRQKYSHIYASLLAKVKSGEVIRIQSDDGSYKYGVKDWFDNETLKEQYK